MQILWNEACCPAGIRSDEAISFASFAVLRSLGSGSISQVLYAVHRRSNTPVALKVYDKDKLSELSKRQIIRELEIHITLSHPHILACYGAFESEESLFLVLEYAAGGDLFQDLRKRGGKLNEKMSVKRVLYPIMSALEYLHSNDIMHRDLKPENLVLTAQGETKLCDFGLSINLQNERPVTRLGTLEFMAPEIIRCPKKKLPDENKEKEDLWYSKAADCWAVAVLAIELLSGRSPFEGKTREDTAQRVASATYTLPSNLSSGAVDFIQSVLKVDPAERPAMKTMLRHPWIISLLDDRSAAPPPPPPPPPPQRPEGAAKGKSRFPNAPPPPASLQPVGRVLSLPSVFAPRAFESAGGMVRALRARREGGLGLGGEEAGGRSTYAVGLEVAASSASSSASSYSSLPRGLGLLKTATHHHVGGGGVGGARSGASTPTQPVSNDSLGLDPVKFRQQINTAMMSRHAHLYASQTLNRSNSTTSSVPCAAPAGLISYKSANIPAAPPRAGYGRSAGSDPNMHIVPPGMHPEAPASPKPSQPSRLAGVLELPRNCGSPRFLARQVDHH